MNEPMGAPNVTRPGNSIAPTKEAVETAIRESSTLIEALESVAAMYQIPAENIIVDDRVNSIRVTGDTIIAPDRKNPSANTKAIVCAIGAVLDNISQRIDEKLSTYQNTQIAQNKQIASQKTPDPSKGEVIGRFYASDGSEIIAYSSGLVDMDNTPAANAKVSELRATKQIPDFTSDQKKPQSSYFTKEDDIMNGVKTNDDIKMDIDKQVHDISSRINESAYFIDLMDKFYGTTTLGYDLLQSQGFDYVDKTHAMIQEGDTPKGPSSADLKHMRFDNKKIMQAIELINAAKLELAIENPQPKDIYRHPKFKQAIRCLDEQFDCKIIIRAFDLKDDKGHTVTDGSTVSMNDLPQKITISKSKGFQLHGTPIEIDLAGEVFQWNPASKNNMFGQSVVSLMLHEIWHNISHSLERENGEFIFTISSAVMLASSTDNVKNRRVIISKCVESISSMSDRKINRFTKRRLVRQMLAVVSMKHSEAEVKKLGEVAAETGNLEDLDKYMDAMEKFINANDPTKNKKKKPGIGKKIVGSAIFIVGAIMIFTKVLAPLGVLLAFTGGNIGVFGMAESMFDQEQKDQMVEWLQKVDKDEYYADLFASMYKLPPVFGLGPNAKFTANSINKERLDRLIKLDRELGRVIMDPHPSDEERAYAAVTVAKKMLSSGEKLDPAIKKYNEWIVANYSSIKDSEIKDVSSEIFDAKECEDLDTHLQNIVDGNNITVTESAVLSKGIRR
jgi:hypothetical protein